jgi:hypothetical protein
MPGPNGRLRGSPLGEAARSARILRRGRQGQRFGAGLEAPPAPSAEAPANPLAAWVEDHREGRGVWKWRHYLDVYHRHLGPRVGEELDVLEIGIYSGGSLEMWRDYFGPRARIWGADLEPATQEYEDVAEAVFIGDQADPELWRRAVARTGGFDVVIDDGGHETDQQVATLEALLPHLRPGGVYICEDVHGPANGFGAYVAGLARNLNEWGTGVGDSIESPAQPSSFQRAIDSVHLYPYVVVIERRRTALEELVSPKRGTSWQPFYEGDRPSG